MFQKLLHASSVHCVPIASKTLCSPEEGSNSFQNVCMCVWCGVRVFKTVVNVHSLTSDVL